MSNVLVIYDILCRRGKVPKLTYAEYHEASWEVVAGIPPEQIITVEEMLARLEEAVLKRRETLAARNLYPQTGGPH